MYISYVLRGMQAGTPVELEGDIDEERCPGLNLNNGVALLHFLVENASREGSAAESWEEADLTVAFPNREHRYIFSEGRWMRRSNESTLRSRASWGFLLGLIGLLSFLVSVVSFSLADPDPSNAAVPTIIGWLAAWFFTYIIAIVAGIIGVIFSRQGLKSASRKRFALTGLILSLITLSSVILSYAIPTILGSIFAQG